MSRNSERNREKLNRIMSRQIEEARAKKKAGIKFMDYTINDRMSFLRKIGRTPYTNGDIK